MTGEHGRLSVDLLARIDKLVDNPTQRIHDPTVAAFEQVGRRLGESGQAMWLIGNGFTAFGNAIRDAAAAEHARQRALVRQAARLILAHYLENPTRFREAFRRAVFACRTPPVPVKSSARRRYQRRR